MHFHEVRSKTVKNGQITAKSWKTVKKQPFCENPVANHLWKCHFLLPFRIWPRECQYGTLSSIQKKPGELPLATETTACSAMTTPGSGWLGGWCTRVWGVWGHGGYGVWGSWVWVWVMGYGYWPVPVQDRPVLASTGTGQASTGPIQPILANNGKYWPNTRFYGQIHGF